MEYDDFFDNMFSSDADFWQEPDFLLSHLVSLMANRLNSQLGVTLLLRGLIMTGVLVGEREYLAGVNDMFKSIAKDTLGKPTKAQTEAIDDAFIFDELTEDDYPDDPVDPDEDDIDDSDPDDDTVSASVVPIRYLHLKDPVIIYPQSVLSLSESPLPIIRIRLTEIDGWMMGRMMVFPMDDDDSADFGPPDAEIRH